MARELAAFRHRLTAGRTVRRSGRRWTVGRLGDTPILTVVLGDGRTRATATLEALFSTFALRRILLIGVAGGLDPTLEVGQLVIATRVLDGDHRAPLPDATWLATATAMATGSSLTSAAVLTVDHLVTDPEEKARRWQHRPEASPGQRPAVVDLESAALAHTAAAAGVPYLVLRAVSDGAEEALPPCLRRCQRPDGSIHQGKVALAALLSPTTIPQLLRLARRVNRCAEALADLALKVAASKVAGTE
jgi:adenosylhomocysteine nucleosidase